MTWEQLIDRTILAFDSNVPRIKVKKYLEEAEDDMVHVAKVYHRDWSYMVAELEGKILLPPDFVELAGNVEYKTRVIKPFPQAQDYSRYRTDGTLRSGDPDHYLIDGDHMHLIPESSGSGLVTFQYVARPPHLEDSATDYNYLKYDGLTSNQFYIGDSIKNTTANTTATVADVEKIAQKTGYLVLENISGTGFANNDTIIATGSEEEMWEAHYGSLSALLAVWDDVGLAGKATVNGVKFSYASAGDEPSIPDVFHHILPDYAKSMLAEDIGDQRSGTFYARYSANRDMAKRQYANRDISGPVQVQDAFNSYL